VPTTEALTDPADTTDFTSMEVVQLGITYWRDTGPDLSPWVEERMKRVEHLLNLGTTWTKWPRECQEMARFYGRFAVTQLQLGVLQGQIEDFQADGAELGQPRQFLRPVTIVRDEIMQSHRQITFKYQLHGGVCYGECVVTPTTDTHSALVSILEPLQGGRSALFDTDPLAALSMAEVVNVLAVPPEHTVGITAVVRYALGRFVENAGEGVSYFLPEPSVPVIS
jgi:hypothetical protein